MIVVEYTCAKFCTQQNETQERKKLPIKWSSNSAVCLWEEKSLKTYIKLEKKPIEGVLHVQSVCKEIMSYLENELIFSLSLVFQAFV